VTTNNRIALAVAATAGIGAIALLAVLRSDSFARRNRSRGDTVNTGYQLDRWANEGGSLADEVAEAGPQASDAEHA
jgi:hypothetical protein